MRGKFIWNALTIKRKNIIVGIIKENVKNETEVNKIKPNEYRARECKIIRKNLDRELSQFIVIVLLSTDFQRKNDDNNQQQIHRQVNLLIEYENQNSIANLMRNHSVMSHAVESSICIFFFLIFPWIFDWRTKQHEPYFL